MEKVFVVNEQTFHAFNIIQFFYFRYNFRVIFFHNIEKSHLIKNLSLI